MFSNHKCAEHTTMGACRCSQQSECDEFHQHPCAHLLLPPAFKQKLVAMSCVISDGLSGWLTCIMQTASHMSHVCSTTSLPRFNCIYHQCILCCNQPGGIGRQNDSVAYQRITRSSLLAAAAQQLRLDCLMVCCALLVGMSAQNLKSGAN
jgi:hypothetical protein